MTLLLLITTFFSFAVQKPQMKNQVYLFNLLIDCPTEQSMKEICVSEGLIEQPSQDGFGIFTYRDGTEIRFKIEKQDDKKSAPYIEVKTRQNKKEIEKILIKLGYRKEGNKYFKGSEFANRQTVCQICNYKNEYDKTLIFTKK